MRKDSDFSLTTHALRTTVSVRKGVLYVLEKDSVKYRKLVLYAFFSASQRTRKFKISCCVRIYGEVVNKEFTSQFSRNCKLMTPSKRDRVLSAAEGLCAAISKPHQESFLLRRQKNSLKEAKIHFGE